MKVKDMVLAALFIALVFIATMFIRIPSPLPNHAGQIHTGTALVFIISVVYGPKMGAISSLGMVLFNLFGAPHLALWAPINLVVRPIMAVIFGYMARIGGANGKNLALNALAALAGGIWMMVGMYVGQAIVFGVPWEVPITALPGNFMQVVLAIAIGLPLIAIMKRHKLFMVPTNNKDDSSQNIDK